jgi:hypothetical protein
MHGVLEPDLMVLQVHIFTEVALLLPVVGVHLKYYVDILTFHLRRQPHGVPLSLPS